MATRPSFNIEELRSQLEAVDGGTWRVERTLRSNPYVETQVVYRNGSQAGPFIRKLIAGNSGQGTAYETLFRAQSSGKRFQHVPFIYDCTRTADGIAVVMEYLQGKTLREYVESTGAGDRAARFAAPALCEALAEIHSALDTPIIHRDIKPGNVMLSPSGLVFIDLDITRFWQDGAERDTTRFGTPGYAPPEQFGFGQTGVASDIFAAGMTLAFCCTGEDPTTQLRESGFADPRIPEWIRPILVRATQFDPQARYQSSVQMQADVAAAIAGQTIPSGSGQARNPKPDPAAPQRQAQPSTSAPTTASYPANAVENQPPRESTAKTTLKYIWNACVIAITLYFMAALTMGFVRGIEESGVDLLTAFSTRPVIAVIATIELILMYFVILVGGDLAAFKVHLRKREPFSEWTWRQELPVGIAFIVFVYLIFTFTSQMLSV